MLRNGYLLGSVKITELVRPGGKGAQMWYRVSSVSEVYTLATTGMAWSIKLYQRPLAYADQDRIKRVVTVEVYRAG
jgi:hypothetical protein